MEKKIITGIAVVAAAIVGVTLAIDTKDHEPGATLGDKAVAEILLAAPEKTDTVRCEKVWAIIGTKPMALKWSCGDSVQPESRQAFLDADAPADAVSAVLKYRPCASGICCDRTYTKGAAPLKPETAKVAIEP